MHDIIYGQDAIDAVENDCQEQKSIFQRREANIKGLPSAQQHGRIFQEIVVEYSSYNIYPEYIGKPYFSIKYMENGQEFIGYGTYAPEVLSEYLKKYFMPSAQPEIIRCKDCVHYYGEPGNPNIICFQMHEDDFCSYRERREE